MAPLDRVLDRSFYGNPLDSWLIALAVLVGVWLLLAFLRRVLVRRLERFASRTSTPVDDVALGALRRTSTLFLLVLGIAAAAHTALELPARVTTAVELFTKLVLLLQGARWGTGAMSYALDRVTRERAEHDKASLTTVNVLGLLARVVLWAILFLLALNFFGVDITALVTGLGIVGVAVALAVQNILGDLFASLSIALDKPFVIGDTINVDQLTGTVQSIGLKTTRLRSLSGELLVFSNADLLKSRIRNFRGQWERRVAFSIGLSYDTPPDLLERVPAIVREIVGAQEQVRFDRSHFAGFAPASLTIETVYYVSTGDYTVFMDTQQRINLALMRRLAADGIALAVPAPAVVVQGAPIAPQRVSS